MQKNLKSKISWHCPFNLRKSTVSSIYRAFISLNISNITVRVLLPDCLVCLPLSSFHNFSLAVSINIIQLIVCLGKLPETTLCRDSALTRIRKRSPLARNRGKAREYAHQCQKLWRSSKSFSKILHRLVILSGILFYNVQ